MIAGGLSSRGFLLQIISYAEKVVPGSLSGEAGTIAGYALAVLAFLVSLGGIAVAIGGVLMLLRHSALGRLLVALGGGAGFIGLMLGAGYALATQGPSGILQHVYYWVGVALAAVARWIAR